MLAKTADICVVGAGPAGLSFALSFPEKNRILVLEKEYFPRDKVCGGGLIPKSIKLLCKLGVTPGKDFPARKIKKIVFSFDIGEKAYDVSEKNFMVTRRIDMDFALFKKAKSEGVKIEEGVKFLEYKESEGKVVVLTNKGSLECKKLVIAMGSYFKRDSYKTVRWFENHNVGDEWVFSIRNFGEEFCYFWKFDGYGFSNLGFASINKDLRKIKEEIGIWGKNKNKDFFVINKFDPKTRLKNGNIFFIGDSYGVETFGCEGISSALHQGIILSRILQGNPNSLILSFRSYYFFYFSPIFIRFMLFYFLSSFFYRNEKTIKLLKEARLSNIFNKFIGFLYAL